MSQASNLMLCQNVTEAVRHSLDRKTLRELAVSIWAVVANEFQL